MYRYRRFHSHRGPTDGHTYQYTTAETLSDPQAATTTATAATADCDANIDADSNADRDSNTDINADS